MNRRLVAVVAVLLTGPSVLAGNFATPVMEATFKLYHPDSTSACFLVQQDEAVASSIFLVTTAHTLERMNGETAVLVLRSSQADGRFKRLDHTIQIRREEKALWLRHEQHDLAVLALSAPLPVEVAALPLGALADEARLVDSGADLCSPLFVLTYPERFEGSAAGLPVARQGIFATPPLLPQKANPKFLADFTTFAGDSGGPVFMAGRDGGPLVVGVVLARHQHEDRMKSGYEDRVVRHPLGLGTILHASFVIEALEAAAANESTAGD